MKRAVVTGTVLASFACEGFSLDRLLALTSGEIARRSGEMASHFAL